MSGSPGDALRQTWPLPKAERLRDALLAAYADASRSYHDTRHLREVLARLDDLAERGVRFDRLPVVLAAWFHDGVYDGERDAEERSAVWAEDALEPLLDPETVEEVARLVRMTETHRPEPDDAEGCALSDADLAILAAPEPRYLEYAAQVRGEYADLDDDLFATGRIAVLGDLLAQDTLFSTEAGRGAWERDARANAGAELARLTPSSSGAQGQ